MHLSISIALQTIICAMSFKRGKPKLFQQTQPCRLALKTAFGNEGVAPHFCSSEEKAQVMEHSAPGCSAC